MRLMCNKITHLTKILYILHNCDAFQNILIYFTVYICKVVIDFTKLIIYIKFVYNYLASDNESRRSSLHRPDGAQ